jgi:arginyl-tRNA synthetase
MSPVLSIASEIESRLCEATARVLPTDEVGFDPQVRRSNRGDFQANGLLALAKRSGRDPREIAEKVVASLDSAGLIRECDVSGPGFLNISVSDSALLEHLMARRADERLGVPLMQHSITVIDYSQPNIAKEMHVGHLRSTIIGDALARTLGFLGEKVIRHNHLGDWGTQFGMLIQYLFEHGMSSVQREGPVAGSSAEESVSRLNQLYRDSRKKFDSDEAFAERARARVVALQAGDSDTLAGWQEIVAESKIYFNEVYAKLDVLLTDEDAVGESFYNPFLADVADELARLGVAQISDGALCVFFDDVKGKDGKPTPLIIRKSDGGFGYAATDLAAIRYRIGALGAHRILYVVDARQALHFQMVFETARRAGWLNDDVTATHVAFGTVLGPDGKPFKTRAGGVVRLISLLDEAVERAEIVVAAKSRHLDPQDLARTARQVGIGAVKYADLANNRAKDYVFDIDRMVSLSGNTGVYMQYAHARTRSILRRVGTGMAASARVNTGVPLEPAERALALKLDEFGAALDEVATTFEPHRLCSYLFELAQTFTSFFESCPVLRAPDKKTQENRIVLCQLSGETLKAGLNLLGIAAPDQL